MRSTEFLSELRRNPTLNVKQEGHEAAVKYLLTKGKYTKNFCVSMTNLPKLGINPGSTYNTPVGVYFYPADYYIRNKVDGLEMPFQDDAPYIQIFEIVGNVEDISNMGREKYQTYVGKLMANVHRIAPLVFLTEKECYVYIADLAREAASEAKVDTYGGMLWYILYALSNYSGPQKRNAIAPRSSVIWNSIFRMIDVDAVIDEGEGIIHVNEKYQGVVINPRAIRQVNTFQNKDTSDRRAELEIKKEKAIAPMIDSNPTGKLPLYFIRIELTGGKVITANTYAANDSIAVNNVVKHYNVGGNLIHDVIATKLG
jgi:hypothetical protein